MTLSEDYAEEIEENKERHILEELRYFREIAKELDRNKDLLICFGWHTYPD